MSQGAHTKDGRVYVIRAYSRTWKQNAFYTGKVNGKIQHTKELRKAKEYKTPHNAKQVADQISKQMGVVHRHAIKW